MTNPSFPPVSTPLQPTQKLNLQASANQPPPFAKLDLKISTVVQRVIPYTFPSKVHPTQINAEIAYSLSPSMEKAKSIVNGKFENENSPIEELREMQIEVKDAMSILRDLTENKVHTNLYRFSTEETVIKLESHELEKADFAQAGNILFFKAQHQHKAKATAKALGLNPQTTTVLVIADDKWSSFIAEVKQFKAAQSSQEEKAKPTKDDVTHLRRHVDEDDRRLKEKADLITQRKEKKKERVQKENAQQIHLQYTTDEESRIKASKDRDLKAKERDRLSEKKDIGRYEKTQENIKQENQKKETDSR